MSILHMKDWVLGSDQRTYLCYIVFVCRSGSRRDQLNREQERENKQKKKEAKTYKRHQEKLQVKQTVCVFVDVFLLDVLGNH